MPLLFSEIYKRDHYCAGSVALSNHNTNYGAQEGFPYDNLTIVILVLASKYNKGQTCKTRQVAQELN